jgi:hypothetical protein
VRLPFRCGTEQIGEVRNDPVAAGVDEQVVVELDDVVGSAPKFLHAAR